ncbi:MAG: CaiB/BaiF CoA-transferase family protein [Pseudomonadota bacterium]
MVANPENSALAGVRVLDLSRVLAGPWATQVLGDLGAEVIKIERPGAGDDTRGWGPPFLKTESGDQTDAAYFLCANRNKKSVALDIAAPEGQALVKRLAATSHIVVENFKTGGLKKYGLDYESLKADNPALVYCSITGFGHDGPYAQRAGYDYLIQAMGGLMSITGQPDGAPGAEPMKVGVAVADLFTGMYAVTGVLAALRHAERTGVGQHLDLALFDCQAAMLANQAMNYFIGGQAPGRLGNAHPNIAPYQVFAAKDGHIVIAVGNERQFKAFCEVLGAPEIAGEADYATNEARVRNRDALTPRLSPLISAWETAKLMAALEAAGVPYGPINTIDEVFESELAAARGLSVDMTRPAEGAARYLASPLKLSETPVRNDAPPPPLGADTEDVLKTALGLSAEDIASLGAKGVI